MQDYGATIYTQYGASPVITTLLGEFNAAADPEAQNTAFYNLVWNVLTAQGYGLDVWGRIVGVNRVIQVPSSGTYLGYEEAGAGVWQPFGPGGLGPFFFGQPASSNFALSDAAFRLLILAKALANISRASIPVYNAILGELFPGRGNCYVTDTGNMTETLTFEFTLLPYELSVIKSSGAIQPPTGVGFVVLQVAVPVNGQGGTFGFHEMGYAAAPFNQGPFFAGFS